MAKALTLAEKAAREKARQERAQSGETEEQQEEQQPRRRRGRPPGSGRIATVSVPTNGYDPEKLQNYMKQLDEGHAKLEKLAGSLRADINAIYTRAADVDGIPKKLLKMEYAHHSHLKRRREKIAGLEENERTQLTMMQEALGAFGETPLGASALARADAAGNA